MPAPKAKPQTKEDMKKLLEGAKLEIDKSLKRVNKADETDLKDMTKKSASIAAFFDFNKGCG